METKRVLIGDASSPFRETLCQVLADQPQLRIVAEVATGAAAMACASELQPDVAILDVHLPDGKGLEIANELRRLAPATQVVLLVTDDGWGYRVAAAKQGAACVAKARLVEDLPAAIEQHAAGTDQGPDTSIEGVTEMGTYVREPAARTEAKAGIRASGRRFAFAANLKPALAIFLIGVLLLALASFFVAQVQESAVEQSMIVAADGSALVVDESGLLGKAGAIVHLDPGQRAAYVQALLGVQERERGLCVGVAFFSLLICSLLVGWLEARDRTRSGEPGTTY